MAVHVRLFASLREAACTASTELDPGLLPELVNELCDRYGEPFATRVRIAGGLVDGRPVRLDEPVTVPDGAELALLPPMSGGAGIRFEQRRERRLLLVGSILVPALLGLGVGSAPWAFLVAVAVIGLACVFDLHLAFGALGARTVLPAAVLLAVGPPLLVVLQPAQAVRWTAVILALGVMLAFLMVLVSDRRDQATLVLGGTLVSGLLIAAGTASLLVQRSLYDEQVLVGALALIGVTDVVVTAAARPSRIPLGLRGLFAPAVAVGLPGLILMYVIAYAPLGPTGLLLSIAIGAAAVLGVVLSAGLYRMIQAAGAADAYGSALLFGTADAVLLSAPLAFLFTWLVLL